MYSDRWCTYTSPKQWPISTWNFWAINNFSFYKKMFIPSSKKTLPPALFSLPFFCGKIQVNQNLVFHQVNYFHFQPTNPLISWSSPNLRRKLRPGIRHLLDRVKAPVGRSTHLKAPGACWRRSSGNPALEFPEEFRKWPIFSGNGKSLVFGVSSEWKLRATVVFQVVV